jgi:hypothetical protein
LFSHLDNVDGPTGVTRGLPLIGETMMRLVALASVLAITLAGCGSDEPNRTSGGMATGAGTGALIGLIGGPIGVVVGAAVGAGAGALTATNTSPKSVNLGDPIWANAPGVPANAQRYSAATASDGGLAPPQPLEPQSAQPQSYAPQQYQAGATPLPVDAPIHSQPLQP